MWELLKIECVCGLKEYYLDRIYQQWINQYKALYLIFIKVD
jgi:hypothetical protein